MRSRIGALLACAAAASPLLDRLADLDKQKEKEEAKVGSFFSTFFPTVF